MVYQHDGEILSSYNEDVDATQTKLKVTKLQKEVNLSPQRR